MRFDPAIWKSLPGGEAFDYYMSNVFDRALRFRQACDAERIPFNVCGGMAVMAWPCRTLRMGLRAPTIRGRG